MYRKQEFDLVRVQLCMTTAQRTSAGELYPLLIRAEMCSLEELQVVGLPRRSPLDSRRGA